MTEDPQRGRRRLIGMGFVLAFLLSTATIIYTGLNVRAPGSAGEARTSSAAEAGQSAPLGASTNDVADPSAAEKTAERTTDEAAEPPQAPPERSAE